MCDTVIENKTSLVDKQDCENEAAKHDNKKVTREIQKSFAPSLSNFLKSSQKTTLLQTLSQANKGVTKSDQKLVQQELLNRVYPACFKAAKSGRYSIDLYDLQIPLDEGMWCDKSTKWCYVLVKTLQHEGFQAHWFQDGLQQCHYLVVSWYP
jgi:hypothetical protein